MTAEFGRRKPVAKAQAAAAAPVAAKADDDAQGSTTDVIFSWLFRPLGGVIVGVLVVCLIVSFYVSGMRGMGRALDDSWARKAIIPVENVDLSGSLCDRKLVNATAEFRNVLHELCDPQR